MVYVLLVYLFFPAFHLAFTEQPLSLYQHLTAGLLSGQFHLDLSPEIQLQNLSDPYNPLQNYPYRLHDASLYQGKYYLYFGLLPVLFFYLPIKLITGFYPSDGAAVFFFLSLSFLLSYFLLIKIKERYFPKISPWQLILVGLLIGYGNGVTILLSIPRVYEAAIASALCFMTFALYFLYQFFHKQQRIKDLFLFGLCLALTVAGRPHFALTCIAVLLALSIYLWTKGQKNQRLMKQGALILGPLLIALALAAYNYLRFGSIFDFGHIWQLSCQDIRDLHGRMFDLGAIVRNLYYSFYFYFLQPLTLSSEFPFIRIIQHNCLYIIDKDYSLEAVAGVLITTPLISLTLALPAMLKLAFKDKQPLAWFLLFLAIISAVNVLILLILPFAIQRYEVDFLPYLVILALISYWLLNDYYGEAGWFKYLRLFFYSSVILSIILGISFSLTYWVF